MAETPRDIESGYHAHEARDVDVRGLTLSALGLAVLLVGTLVLIGWLFMTFGAQEQRTEVPSALVATQPDPPAPRLQASPTQDLRAMQRAEDEKLHSYSWVDASEGIASIPIDRAIDLLAQRGLPTWSEAQETGREQEGSPP
jgi:hypothetical protein